LQTTIAPRQFRGAVDKPPQKQRRMIARLGFRNSNEQGAAMQQRLDAMKVSPAAYRAIAGLQGYVDQSGLERSLIELVKIRTSQINGCAYCLVMHTDDARKYGENDERMHLLNAWREAPVFSERERAALAWTEALTLVADGHVPDAVYDQARKQFSEKELVDLTVAAVAINAWNRVAIAFRATPQLKLSRAAA
jgi:AhpD family alkylhydroperoxidase